MQEGSTNTLDKVSISTSRKKNRGMFSFVRRRFSRKRKESPQYSSAPSVIQYTDNVFMVERTAGDQVRFQARPKNYHKIIESISFPSILKYFIKIFKKEPGEKLANEIDNIQILCILFELL
jgi:hypothetical protein